MKASASRMEIEIERSDLLVNPLLWNLFNLSGKAEPEDWNNALSWKKLVLDLRFASVTPVRNPLRYDSN
jgi:hypothetical protein